MRGAAGVFWGALLLLPRACPSSDTGLSDAVLEDIELPVVDLSAANAAAQLDRAARTVGFVTIVNHGAEASAAAALAEMQRWFRRRGGAPDPPATKPSPGYGPGLQYREHLAAEVRSLRSFREGSSWMPRDNWRVPAKRSERCC